MGRFEIAGEGRLIVGNRIINKIGFDTGVLVAIIDNDLEWQLNHALFLINNGHCFVYKLVVNQIIGVLITKRNYDKNKAIERTLSFLRKNKIMIIKEGEDFNVNLRDAIFEDLKIKRRKLIRDRPEDSDLDILASYKATDVNCIVTTNFKHFIELGKQINIYIEPIRKEKDAEAKRVDKMFRGVFWKRPK